MTRVPTRRLPRAVDLATALAACIALAACAGTPADAAGRARGAGSDPAGVDPAQIARSADGMVVSGQPAATAVGAQVLAAGGNAVDAAVATAFALTVVEPSMSSIGGRTQMLIRTAAGELVGIDGTTEVAADYDSAQAPATDLSSAGYGTIAIPGTVAALTAALERYGTWPLDRVLAPAIALAVDGFPIGPAEARRMEAAAARLARSAGARRSFLKPSGEPYRAGEIFRQPVLAATLRRIAQEGPDAFYRGEIARQIAADMAENGGFVDLEDLASYEAEPAIVVHGSYRGHDLVGTYLPASGATTIEIMQILEQFDMPAVVGTAEWIALVARASRSAFADRTRDDLGPPEAMARTLTSKTWAAERAAEIRRPVPAAAGAAVPGAVNLAFAHESANTTHLSVVDGAGTAVALTQSVGPTFGSHVATPGLGFIYASTQGYLATVPGERPWSSQSPLIVLRDGRPEYVLGGAGARRIISALVELLSRAIDEGLAFPEAAAAPRFHTLDDEILLEDRPGTRWPTDAYAELRAQGFEPGSSADPLYFARINAIHYDAARGEYVGLADPRWPGGAAAPRGATAAEDGGAR